MNKIEMLADQFKCLEPYHIENLIWHVENKTPICCGKQTYLFTDGLGGG